MDVCIACSVFAFDWMIRPPAPTDYFARNVRRTYLEKAIPDLLPEIHRLLSKVNELMKYVIMSKITSVLQAEKRRFAYMSPGPQKAAHEKELLELEWTTTVQLFREHVSREDIDYLLQMIEERYILDSATTNELWLGMTLSMLMKELPLIHGGHSIGTLESAAIAMNGFICPGEHEAAKAMFEGDSDDLYA